MKRAAKSWSIMSWATCRHHIIAIIIIRRCEDDRCYRPDKVRVLNVNGWANWSNSRLNLRPAMIHGPSDVRFHLPLADWIPAKPLKFYSRSLSRICVSKSHGQWDREIPQTENRYFAWQLIFRSVSVRLWCCGGLERGYLWNVMWSDIVNSPFD